MLVVTASEMSRLDRETIEQIGIPGAVLMENAARGAASFFLDAVPDLLSRPIAILAGSGNNAGDGFVLARIFHGKGARVRVVCLRDPSRLKGDALTNFLILEKLNIPVHVWDESKEFDAQLPWVEESGAVIDALLGTGLNTEVQGLYRQVIEAVNGLSVPVLAVDVPSGLDASTGKPLGTAIRATATATFGYLKAGQLIEPGMQFVGRLSVVDIGIPPTIPSLCDIRRWWLDEEFVSGWIGPRAAGIHKGTAGHVAVLSGSRGKTGAATLISLGAARVGAGLVTLFIPESLNPILEVKLTEAMTYPIAETDEQTPDVAALPAIMEFLEGKQALAIGPGISLHPGTRGLVKALIERAPCPMVLDADALTIVSDDLDLLGKAQQPLILTPHPGEMARLVHGTVQDVQADRIGAASDFSMRHGVTLVLKGHRTIIAAPDGRLAINSSGNPAMAGGGMGDTLTGMIAGFAAQGAEPFQAACLAVYIHGAAADARIGKIASRGLLASDLLEEIPRAIGRLEGFPGGGR
ncbi:MAG: NAD(P)H-hydrate dehydratase [Syntrophobacteraceae bacterium]|nr:NAD(P)H-hydrate dehydratase [Desulfobacteraceae bacterium]